MKEKTGIIDKGGWIRMAAATILLALLTGCAQENVKQALDNLSKDCDRHYTFAASSGTVGGSLTVSGTADCKHEVNQPAATPTPSPAPAGPPPFNP